MPALTAPPRRPPPDALEIELHDMARASELGFPQFPPPPPPMDPSSAARAHLRPSDPGEPEFDTMRLVTRILICIALAIPALSFWYVWKN